MADTITRTRCLICESRALAPFAVIDHRSIVRCCDCSLIFADSFSESELYRFYRENFYPSPHDPRIQSWIDSHQRTWEGLVKDLHRAKSPVDSLLDIGAGTGGFLETFHRLSPATKLYAIESSPQARQNLKARLQSLVFCGESAKSICDTSERFDSVVLLQCLEHVYDPLLVCSGIYRSLNQNGVLLVTVPNRYSYKVLLQGTTETYCYSNRTHLQFFNMRIMRAILRKAGFRHMRRITRFGGSELTGTKAILQCLARKIGISTELRFIAWKVEQKA